MPVKPLFNKDCKGFILSVRGFRFDTIAAVQAPAVNGKIPGAWIDAALQAAENNAETEISADDTPEWDYIADTASSRCKSRRGRKSISRLVPLSLGTSIPTLRGYEWGDLDAGYLLQNSPDDSHSSAIITFSKRVQAVTWDRRLAVIDEGFIGLVPLDGEFLSTAWMVWMSGNARVGSKKSMYQVIGWKLI